MTKLDQNGLNLALGSVILPDVDMRGLGFTDHAGDNWYYYVKVESDITFNLTIPKNGGRLRIDVLDEDFCQPYDYQRILKDNPSFPYALAVKARVENQMERLSEAGVITGYTPGMYI